MDRKRMEVLWNHLHTHAEISWKEVETTNYLVALFKKSGFHPVRFQHIPGFYVEIGNDKPVVGLRADMDALWQEVDGEHQANHSCGHDAHMTIVTEAMHLLKKMEGDFSGTIRAIFQPAEELGNGANRVVEEGIIDDMDYLFGIHLRPKSEIGFPNCAPGIQHGACLFVKGEIKGEDYHGARPHEGINAIEVGGIIQQHLKNIHISPFIPASIKMTNFHAGTDNFNIIPGKATFGLDIRSQTNEGMTFLKGEISRLLEHISNIYNVPIEYELIDDVPAAMINPEAEKIMEQAIIHTLGKNALVSTIETPGSDDFHYYTANRPQVKATMLALGANVSPGLHHPHMTFNHESLKNGVEVLVEACMLATKK